MDSKIRRQFNRSAPRSYDLHAVVQREMADTLVGFIADLRKDKRVVQVLDIGCGTGALTAKLLAEWPDAAITALDLAPAMLNTARSRICDTGSGGDSRPSIQFELADAEEWVCEAPSNSFDLVASSACFQWFSTPQQTLSELRRLLKPGGLLAFATFGPQTFRELHSSFEAAYRNQGLTPQRHGLSFQTASEWEMMIKKAGFIRQRHHQIERTEQFPSVRDFLHAVKSIGASTSEASLSEVPVMRRLFSDMFQTYDTLYSHPNGVFATYDILFLHAFG